MTYYEALLALHVLAAVVWVGGGFLLLLLATALLFTQLGSLDAEVVRDSALFVGGLLVERLGGRSVKPYQPANIWEPVAFVAR